MIRFKNKYLSQLKIRMVTKINPTKKPGFTLIEAMIAITIMGMVLAPMFLLETNVFNGVVRMGEQFERLLFAKYFLYIAQQQESQESTDYTLEQKKDRPLSMVRYTLKPIAQQSSLSPIKRLFKQEVIASGMVRGSPQANFVCFIYKPEPVPS